MAIRLFGGSAQWGPSHTRCSCPSHTTGNSRPVAGADGPPPERTRAGHSRPSPRTRGALPPPPPRLRELAGAELRLLPPLHVKASVCSRCRTKLRIGDRQTDRTERQTGRENHAAVEIFPLVLRLRRPTAVAAWCTLLLQHPRRSARCARCKRARLQRALLSLEQP